MDKKKYYEYYGYKELRKMDKKHLDTIKSDKVIKEIEKDTIKK